MALVLPVTVSVMLITFVVGFKSSQRTNHVKPLIEILTASLEKKILLRGLKFLAMTAALKEKRILLLSFHFYFFRVTAIFFGMNERVLKPH